MKITVTSKTSVPPIYSLESAPTGFYTRLAGPGMDERCCYISANVLIWFSNTNGVYPVILTPENKKLMCTGQRFVPLVNSEITISL